MNICNREINITKEELFKMVQRDNGFRGRAKIESYYTTNNSEDEVVEFQAKEYKCYAFVSSTKNYYSDSYGTFYYPHSVMLKLLRKNGYIA